MWVGFVRTWGAAVLRPYMSWADGIEAVVGRSEPRASKAGGTARNGRRGSNFRTMEGAACGSAKNAGRMPAPPVATEQLRQDAVAGRSEPRPYKGKVVGGLRRDGRRHRRGERGVSR
jgi:hypothetical protein